MMAKEPLPVNSSTGDSQRVLCDKCKTESVGLLPRHLSNGAATSSVNFVDERDKSDSFHKPTAGVLLFATFEVGLLREEVVAALLAASTASMSDGSHRGVVAANDWQIGFEAAYRRKRG